jgi:hypothetical protein
MKRICLLFLFFFSGQILQAQMSNAVLFTENGEKFTAILNGVRQNEKPESNVKITGLNAEFYKLKVIFENPALGERNMNLYINTGTETSYSIRKNNKGEFVLRLVSEVPVALAPPSNQPQYVTAYNQNAANANKTHTHTTTTTTVKHTQDNVNISMGVPGRDNTGITIQASGEEGEITEQQTMVFTHTEMVSSSTHASEHAEYIPGYAGAVGCNSPMTVIEFSDVKNAVAAKSFEDSRMSVAREALIGRCIITDHVKELMMLFTFEKNRLTFAKYAFDHTYDINNYFKLNDAFTFETSVEELDTYIRSRQ